MAPLKGEFPLSLWWHYSRLISFNDQKKKKKLSKCSLLTLTLSTKSVVTFCFPLTTYIDGRQKEKKDKT